MAQMQWWDDKSFSEYLKKFDEAGGCNSDRRWAVHQLLRLTVDVDGDTAECGVYAGAMSWLICRANRDQGSSRAHHIFDSFEGLSAPRAEDGTHWNEGALTCGLDTVRKNLAEFDGHVNYYPGWIPARFEDVSDRKFSFLHIDVDLYEPTRDTVKFFYPLLNPGAIVVCDDYGFTSCPGATKAMDEVLEDKPEKMISLPDGGGFFIKGKMAAARADLH